ncbi:MAG: hypothetical protein GX218_01715, partial [Clostridiaceae bacterium]|nr:hypothetical protein [Clostridiaceae bacterium]
HMLKKVLPHICIIISVMMLTFYVIDRVNSAMSFLNNDIFKNLLLVYCLAVIATSIFLIADNRRSRK